MGNRSTAPIPIIKALNDKNEVEVIRILNEKIHKG